MLVPFGKTEYFLFGRYGLLFFEAPNLDALVVGTPHLCLKSFSSSVGRCTIQNSF
jgi:hypothetical protein